MSSLTVGWHGCRFEIVSVLTSGMVGRAYIYARKANKITQQAVWKGGLGARGQYAVTDHDTGGDYTADTLKQVMQIAEQREQTRLKAVPPSRTRRGK